MKLTSKSPMGTSFHNVTIIATLEELIRVLGQPQWRDNTGRDKVNFQWVMQTEADGDVVTVYDYNTGHSIEHDERILWHIGGHGRLATEQAKREMVAALNAYDRERYGGWKKPS